METLGGPLALFSAVVNAHIPTTSGMHWYNVMPFILTDGHSVHHVGGHALGCAAQHVATHYPALPCTARNRHIDRIDALGTPFK